jgi:protein O-GlcNAc transferase
LIAVSKGQDENALDFFEKAVNLRPTYSEANFMLGELLRKFNRLELARDSYQRALKQSPTVPVNHVRLGAIYLLLNDNNKAYDVFRRAAEQFPEISEIQYFFASSARGKGEYDLAIAALNKSLALKPDNVDALSLLGAILLDRNKAVEAERLFRRAISLSENHFNSFNDLGRLLVKSRRYEEALPILQRAAALSANNPDVRYQLFLAYSRLNRKVEADRELAIYKQLNEKKEPAKP